MSTTRQLQSKYTQLAQLLDSRSTTERALIFITACLVIYMLFLVAFVSPLDKANSHIQETLAAKQAEKNLLDQELSILMENLRQAPKESKLIRLEELKDELTGTGNFSKLMKELIPPREMVQFVDGVLSSNKRLKVVRANNVPAIQLWPNPEEYVTTETGKNISIENSQQPSPEDEFTIYKHGLLLEVKGSYRELITFLATLEKLPWKILWGDVSLTSGNGNDSVVRLMIYTLSPDNAWMGL